MKKPEEFEKKSSDFIENKSNFLTGKESLTQFSSFEIRKTIFPAMYGEMDEPPIRDSNGRIFPETNPHYRNMIRLISEMIPSDKDVTRLVLKIEKAFSNLSEREEQWLLSEFSDWSIGQSRMYLVGQAIQYLVTKTNLCDIEMKLRLLEYYYNQVQNTNPNSNINVLPSIVGIIMKNCFDELEALINTEKIQSIEWLEKSQEARKNKILADFQMAAEKIIDQENGKQISSTLSDLVSFDVYLYERLAKSSRDEKQIQIAVELKDRLVYLSAIQLAIEQAPIIHTFRRFSEIQRVVEKIEAVSVMLKKVGKIFHYESLVNANNTIRGFTRDKLIDFSEKQKIRFTRNFEIENSYNDFLNSFKNLLDTAKSFRDQYLEKNSNRFFSAEKETDKFSEIIKRKKASIIKKLKTVSRTVCKDLDNEKLAEFNQLAEKLYGVLSNLESCQGLNTVICDIGSERGDQIIKTSEILAKNGLKNEIHCYDITPLNRYESNERIVEYGSIMEMNKLIEKLRKEHKEPNVVTISRVLHKFEYRAAKQCFKDTNQALKWGDILVIITPTYEILETKHGSLPCFYFSCDSHPKMIRPVGFWGKVLLDTGFSLLECKKIPPERGGLRDMFFQYVYVAIKEKKPKLYKHSLIKEWELKYY